MRVQLLSPGADTDLSIPGGHDWDDVVADLELRRLWDAMAAGDDEVRQVVQAATLRPARSVKVIRYRQRAVQDALAHPDAIADLYELAGEAATVERGLFMMPVEGHPEMMLTRDVRMLDALADCLDRLRGLCERFTPVFESTAFTGLFDRVRDELNEEYVEVLRHRLRQLEFPGGLLLSAGLGRGGQVNAQVLRVSRPENRHLFSSVALKKPHATFTLPDRDVAGADALNRLRDRSVDDVSNTASQAVDHVKAFVVTLRAELAFFVGAINLARSLGGLDVQTCMPEISSEEDSDDSNGVLSATGICDPCLALRVQQAPVTNDVEVPEGALLVVTGSNHGGKSTLLRALGVAQLMAQAGLFAAAGTLRLRPVGRVFTHWAREEDAELRRGKLDEELARMSRIIDQVRPGDLLLSNESFSSTNEAEGSQLALDVTAALADSNVRIFLVTHLYDFAHRLEQARGATTVFLRAPRSADGSRSYRLEPGPPLDTSFGLDLFDREFGTHLADRIDAMDRVDDE